MNSAPTLVLKFEYKGGLNHIMFLGRFFLLSCRDFLFSSLGSVLVYFISRSCPLFLRAVLYAGAALSNISLDDERVDMRFSTLIGMCLIIDGGWLDCVCTYTGVSLGFL